MDYTDYGSLQSKNSSNSTGAYTNGSRVNAYGSSMQGRPVANGAYSPYTQPDSSIKPNRNISYSSYDASNQSGGYNGGAAQPRGVTSAPGGYPTGAVPMRENSGYANAARPDSTYDRTVRSGSPSPASTGSTREPSANGYGYRSDTNGSNANGNNTSVNRPNGNGATGNGPTKKYTDYTKYEYTPTVSNGGGKGNGNGAGSGNGNGSGKGSDSGNGNGSGKGSGSGNGNGSGKGNGSGSKKPQKNLTFSQKLLVGFKKFLRSIYLMGKPMRIFVLSAAGFVLVCVVLIFAVSGSQHKKTEIMAAQLALATTPSPTIAPTATPVPTPSPTPEVRIEKGAEGEDVMALQKRLMELGYLAIDEPTSYFGNATKYAVKLFQRQHELQQDGICGNDTIALLYSEEAKKYVMTEGAEGDDIESFQEQLVELGYLDDNQVTGYYGSDTVEAVKKFQNRNYITKDGKAGTQTLEEINSADARVSYTKEKEIAAEKKKQAALARASSAEGRIDKMISIAKKQLGDTYILGKSGPDSFDCSGLVYYCLRQVNVYTRRLNAAGLSKTTSWTKISDIDNVKPGDLLFFKSDDSSTVGHVGIYIGGGEMIDASSANGKVVRRGAKTSYWRRNFVVARRPIE
ncbi:MAG: peptidoglycan-binding protein [Christensenella sp.]|nr:peptidoglycan-binding protein [Christensenella sp.]